MREAAETAAMLAATILALAIFGDEDQPETDDDGLPKCPAVIPDWMIPA